MAGSAVFTRTGEPVDLTPKAVDTLVALVERAGHVVEKDELLRAVWNDTFVGEDTLAQNISTLRRVLGDDPVFRSSLPPFHDAATSSSPLSEP